MSFAPDPFVALIDTNAMVPVRARDVLFTFDQYNLFRARLTTDIMDEWERTLVEKLGHAADNVAEQRKVIEEAFEANFVPGYRPLIGALELPDKDDRHVLAAAIKCSAQHIVTHNHTDFPPDILDEYDISTISPDEFLANTYELHKPRAIGALRAIRSKYRNPPMNRSEFLRDLTAQGLPQLAASARDGIEFL